jgi:hypothetical protein
MAVRRPLSQVNCRRRSPAPVYPAPAVEDLALADPGRPATPHGGGDPGRVALSRFRDVDAQSGRASGSAKCITGSERGAEEEQAQVAAGLGVIGVAREAEALVAAEGDARIVARR